MNVVISQRHGEDKHGEPVDSLESTYVSYFETFGMTLFPVSSATTRLPAFLETVRPVGIILSGGGDVPPATYSGPAFNQAINDDRVSLESQLLQFALENKVPVLGVCRGMQFLNVFFSGQLTQDISKLSVSNSYVPPPTEHTIEIIDDRLRVLLNNQMELVTNSFHNQGVSEKDLGTGVGIFASHKDLGLAEGIFHHNYPIAGIQWHPERKRHHDKLDQMLVESFLKRKLFWEVNH